MLGYGQVKLGYSQIRLCQVWFSYIRFLYFIAQELSVLPQIFFLIAILWPLTKQRTFYTNGQGSFRISPLNRGSTVVPHRSQLRLQTTDMTRLCESIEEQDMSRSRVPTCSDEYTRHNLGIKIKCVTKHCVLQLSERGYISYWAPTIHIVLPPITTLPHQLHISMDYIGYICMRFQFKIPIFLDIIANMVFFIGVLGFNNCRPPMTYVD